MLRRTLVLPGVGLLDGVLGAAFGAALALGIIWIVAAVAAQAPGQNELRLDIQRSAILRQLNEILPPSGPILNALARLDPLPSITGPSPNVAAPEPRIAHAPGVRLASAQRGPRARHRLRARNRGLGLGGRSRTGRDERARRGRRAGHDGRGRGQPSGSGGASDRLRPQRRRGSVARAGTPSALPEPRCRALPTARRRRSSAIPRTAPSTCSPRESAARRSC